MSTTSPTLARFPDAVSPVTDSNVTETAVEVNITDTPVVQETPGTKEVDGPGIPGAQPQAKAPAPKPKKKKDDKQMSQNLAVAPAPAPKPKKKPGPQPGWKQAKAAAEAKPETKPKKKPGPQPGWKQAKAVAAGKPTATKSKPKPKSKPKAKPVAKPVAAAPKPQTPGGCVGSTISKLDKEIATLQAQIDKRRAAITTLTELSAE